MTRFADPFETDVTTQSYGAGTRIDGVELVDLTRFRDEGGSMLELARFDGGGRIPGLPGFEPRQINYSTLEPGTIKAFHLHREQTDVWFVPEHDRILLVLHDVRKGSPTLGEGMRFLLGDGVSRWVRIPPGVAHGCRNVGTATARIVYFTDRHFDPDPDRCDEGRLPWDRFGADVWETRRD